MHPPARFRFSIGRLALLAILGGCAAAPRGAGVDLPRPTVDVSVTMPVKGCAIIETDDDIPSGSATAGALFVADAKLGQELLTKDVVATARGFLDAGFTCVRVIDSHAGAIDPAPLRAIGVEVLTPNNSRWTWPFLGDAARHASIAALVGFHSRGDQPTGFRPHTINDNVQSLTMNDVPIGEVAHQILGLGAFGVPVGLVSGDMNAVAEATAFVPEIEQVSVRWRDVAGNTQFLSSDEAGQRLRQGARRAAAANVAPYRPAAPLAIGVTLHSKLAMAALAPSMPAAFAAERAANDWAALGDFEIGPTLRIEGNRATWSAPSALAAYVSIAFAASHLRGKSNSELVDRGYKAYATERFDDAIAAYQQALEANPYDVATRCRMAAAFQKLAKTDEARRWFRAGAENDTEIGDDALKSWCWIGLAETELVMNNHPAAKAAADRTLALPDFGGRHEKAKRVLASLPARLR